ncbi:N-terminal double-transmembrane domain-containing protein [Flavobacteriaceae bacterium MAR_2010_188]|nr:N-terminal double-transmembrane domain-containing protein [Flavobacteriaceae bacterium MAR_2010_188]
MQFKHPELLYALFLLIIPIIVHLFQLRRFQKTEFTNVKFLKSLTLQTRRSSQLKKWLTLLTRMLLMACIIFAFAQPYFSKTNNFNTKNETVIYLDNSFSMQAIGENGTLLNHAIQDIIEYVDEDEPITIFTNNKKFTNTSLKAVKNELIRLPYTADQLSLKSVMIIGKAAFSDDGSSIKNLVMISDFQRNGIESIPAVDTTYRTRLVQLKPENKSNVAIDSVYISDRKAENIELTVKLSNYGQSITDLPVSLYNDDKLVAKSSLDITDTAETTFVIAANEMFNGTISIEEPNLLYDNSLFFNIDNTAKIKVMAVNQDDETFLRKIYTEDEFEYVSFNSNALNFKGISEQNLIILNSVEDVTIALNTAVQSFANDGGTVLFIPSNSGSLASYNQLFTRFNASAFDSIANNEKRITTINFSHPLLLNVFDKKVTNFQYPKVNSYFNYSSLSGSPILSFEDGSPFLTQNGNLYRFTASINETNSNFKNSPLIVPVLYNIGTQSLRISNLYYTIGKEQQIDVDVNLSQDEILSLQELENTVIPLQQTYSNKVRITTDEFPEQAGVVSIKNKEETIKNVSFNYDRKESNLIYHNLDEIESYEVSDSVANAIADIKNVTNVDELWKWFVIFALIFLFTEMLLLKYLK